MIKLDQIFNTVLACVSACLTLIVGITISDKKDMFIIDEILLVICFIFLGGVILYFLDLKRRFYQQFIYYSFLSALVLLIMSSIILFFQY